MKIPIPDVRSGDERNPSWIFRVMREAVDCVASEDRLATPWCTFPRMLAHRNELR